MVLVSSLAAVLPAHATLNQVASRRLATEAAEDIEPALITYTQFGVEYSASAWMKFDPNPAQNPLSTIRVGAWTSNGLSSLNSPPPLASYNRYADPVLVKHQTLNRIFLIAVAINDTDPSNPGEPVDSAIVVWHSNNGGWNWGGPAIIDSVAAGGPILDKPAAATGSDGKLWVAYIAKAASNQVRVRAGTLSGSPLTWTWMAAPQAIPLSFVSSSGMAPQVMLDGTTHVYVLYLRPITSPRIGVVRSAQTTTLSWQALGHLQPVSALVDLGEIITVGSSTIRARTIPVAKLDPAIGRRRLSVAWHENNGSGGTRVRFASFNIDQALPGTWSSILTLSDSGVHNVNVGMDFNPSNGEYVVTWYTFNGSSVYDIRGTYVTFSGGTPSNETSSLVTTMQGDVAYITPAGGASQIGEYHDVSYTNGTFKSVHIMTTSGIDPWSFTVSH
jgi:hypothetical protein